MRLSAFKDEVRKVAVRVGEGSVELSYRPAAHTARYERRLVELQSSDHPAASLCEALADVLVGWDLEDDQGGALPVSLDALEELPTKVVVQFLAAIREDMVPNPTSGEPSAAGS